MYATAKNTSAAPLVIDEDGRTIGGGEWGTVDTTSTTVRAAVDAGSIVVRRDLDSGDVPDDADPALRAAVETTATIRGRAETFAALDRDTLEELALDAGLLAGEPDPTRPPPAKTALVATLARSTVDTPTTPPAPDDDTTVDAGPPTTPDAPAASRRRGPKER